MVLQQQEGQRTSRLRNRLGMTFSVARNSRLLWHCTCSHEVLPMPCPEKLQARWQKENNNVDRIAAKETHQVQARQAFLHERLDSIRELIPVVMPSAS